MSPCSLTEESGPRLEPLVVCQPSKSSYPEGASRNIGPVSFLNVLRLAIVGFAVAAYRNNPVR